MAENTTTQRSGMGLLGWVFVVFLVLKLGVGDTVVQDWSWWWVTAPLWGGFAVALIFFIVVGSVIFVVELNRTRKHNARVKQKVAERAARRKNQTITGGKIGNDRFLDKE